MPSKKSTTSNHFPRKLHEMLDDAEEMGHSHVICWCPDGKSFRINDPKALVPVLNKYFRQTKYKSLLRQLQGYNFKRITSGINKGNVSHPLFRRGMRSQCNQIKRKQNKLSTNASSNSSSNASTNATSKVSPVNRNTDKEDGKGKKNQAGVHRRRQLQQKSGMDALRIEIGCSFSSNEVNRNLASTGSMPSLKRKAPEKIRPDVVESSRSEPAMLDRERLSKRPRIHEGVQSFHSTGLLPSFKNASFPFSRRVSKDYEDDIILANEKMQIQKLQLEKQKQQEFEQLERLCFSNVSQVPGTQQFQHSHNSTSAFGSLDVDISLTTTTTTHHNGGDSHVSSSTFSKNFVLPADLEPTPMLSPRREAKASSGITVSCNIDFPLPQDNTSNEKIYQDIVVNLPPVPEPVDVTSAECNPVSGDSSSGRSSEVSDEIDEDIAQTFNEDVDANRCSPTDFDTDGKDLNEEVEQDDWTKGVVYGGNADCVLEPEKFQIEVQRFQLGKGHQQVPQHKQIGLQQQLQLQQNILRHQQTMMQIQGNHNIPPQPFQVSQRRILSCQQPRHLQMNSPFALLSRPMPIAHQNLNRHIQ